MQVRTDKYNEGLHIRGVIRDNNIGIAKKLMYSYIEDAEIITAFKQYCIDNGFIDAYIDMKPKYEFGMFKFLTTSGKEKLFRDFARKNKITFRTIN